MNTLRITCASRHAQTGGAVLVVVLILFVVAALAAAHAGRSLAVEVRTAARQPLAMQALAAAESGLDWSVAMLGQGRVDAHCQASADPTHATFRARTLAQDAQGRFVPTGVEATCVRAAVGWRCGCAAEATDRLADTDAPGFRVRFVGDARAEPPGTVRLVSRGCARASAACLRGEHTDDGVAHVVVQLAQLGAVAAPPAAALTVPGTLDLGGSAVQVAGNGGHPSGLALITGGSLLGADSISVQGPPGSPWQSAQVLEDPTLAAMAGDGMFVALFGTDPAHHRTQPTALQVTCPADCGTALAHAAAAHPGRSLWIHGPVSVARDLSLGSPDQPVVLVVDGDLHTLAEFKLHGLLMLRGTRWRNDGPPARVHGAVVAAGSLALQGKARLQHDPTVLERLHRHQGSLLRLPGSWRDRAFD